MTIDGTTSPRLYHRSSAFYRPGDLIQPGNWGRVVQGIGGHHQFFFREYLFERIRAAEFPDKPSRLSVAFAFENAGFAQQYGSQGQGALAHVYLVRIAEPETLVHRTDMAWIELVLQYRTFEGAEGCARQYWRGQERAPNAEKMEWLVAGALRVEDRITEIPNGVH